MTIKNIINEFKKRAELSVSGTASVEYVSSGLDYSNNKSSLTMGNAVTFSGSGELDNGMTISTLYVLDESGADSTSNSVSIASGDLTLTFGGIKPMIGQTIDAVDTAFNGSATSGTQERVLNGLGTSQISGAHSNTGNVGLMYTPKNKGYVAGITTNTIDANNSGQHSVSMGGIFTGVDGLTVAVGYATNADAQTAGDEWMYGATYAMGAITVGYMAADTGDDSTGDIEAYGISYAVNPDLSVSYAAADTSRTNNDQDWESYGVAYNMGGATLNIGYENEDSNGSSATDLEGYEVNLTFAF
ncbi:Gram-negative porin [seawater metagenome]|uniref:Gram-negative porin n=1 Tax=seawater metagenome TaxID=1561972 RepID=A0A5E8CKU8_9ZZZZ